ncbi:MAG: LysR family transcriptional regulator [Rhodocyclaceae bacterium]|nr:MAG: LysR family transcriptional regulator [Rhodocyclaceae bacterium]
MSRLESMAVFLAVVEAGSLSAASRHLGMPLATVSRKVSELESHLKARLLHRTTRQLTLTEAGRDYMAACKRILEDVEQAERAAAGEYSVPRGELVISAPIVFGRVHVLPVVTEFLKAYPEVDVRLVQSDRVVNLLDDHVDLAVRIGHLPDSRLNATRVGAIRRVVCGSPDYFARQGVPALPADLVRHQCITFDMLMSSSVWKFNEKGSGEVQVPIHSRLIVNTAEAAIDAAIAGIGVTQVLSYQMEAARQAGLLQVVLPDVESDPFPVSLVYNGPKRLPLKLRAFIDFAAPRLRARMQA